MRLCLIYAVLSEFFKSVKFLKIGLLVFELFDLKVGIAVLPHGRSIFKNMSWRFDSSPPMGRRGDFFFFWAKTSSFFWDLILHSVMDINGAINKKNSKYRGLTPPDYIIMKIGQTISYTKTFQYLKQSPSICL